jgi:hypothetical protein
MISEMKKVPNDCIEHANVMFTSDSQFLSAADYSHAPDF